ncbi:SMP-30/gluconolactonase/LRE family protein [Rhodococcus artemisiae]|uniref:SMP-30/gluconolactonase/LRE family protein n=1 Tax=Rhodococcus artemisiae TaxID=714159 RepID=A0ABU7LBS8_9NOCA|nr:SMP-30/gluconolactonase/LRE family protein [Rhodococcus artemisiae]MEE2059004.1 SMP-30/gluconolactonase/LRE family protein [Rhodococcus artemisiae]
MVHVEVVDARILDLIEPEVEGTPIASGFVFTEGPVWIEEDQCLLFSDLRGSKRGRWSEADGCTVVATDTNKANGMTCAIDGDLVVCEPASSKVVKMSRDGTGRDRTVLASHYGGKELNSPSDCVAKSDGTIWFTDNTAGRRNDISGIKREHSLDFRAVYRLDSPGALKVVSDGFDLCNGLCFSPDERYLYVADTTRCHIVRIELGESGTLLGEAVFASGIGTFDLDEGYVDGLRCDEYGNVWVTGPRGIWIFDPDGHHLGVIPVPEVATNLTWGGPGSTTLYVTATESVYRFGVKVRGAR